MDRALVYVPPGCRGVLFVDVDVVVFVWVLLTFHCHAVFVHIFVEEF